MVCVFLPKFYYLLIKGLRPSLCFDWFGHTINCICLRSIAPFKDNMNYEWACILNYVALFAKWPLSNNFHKLGIQKIW